MSDMDDAPDAGPSCSNGVHEAGKPSSALPAHLAHLEAECLASVSYRGLSHADRQQLEQLLSGCVVPQGVEGAGEQGTVHYFQAYALDYAGAPSREEAAAMPRPQYDLLFEDPLPRTAASAQRSRRPGGFSGRYFDAPEETSTPGVLSAELRALLGMQGPNDPPPYLRRMQQLGYPPGYVGVPGQTEGELKWHVDPGSAGDERSGTGDARAVPLVDIPGINMPPPTGADPAAWNWRGQLRR